MIKIIIDDDLSFTSELIVEILKERGIRAEVLSADIIMCSGNPRMPAMASGLRTRSIEIAGRTDVIRSAMMSIENLRNEGVKMALEIVRLEPIDLKLPDLDRCIIACKPAPRHPIQRKLPAKHAGKHGKFSRSHRWR